MERILKFILGIMIIAIVAIIIIIYYFLIVDIKSNPPQEIQEEYNIKTETYQNRSAFYLTQKQGATNPYTIFYLHGGSYVSEASVGHWEFLKSIAKDTGVTIVIPDYPLAPKYNYKDVFQMLEPLYKDIIEKVGKDKLIVMGDSAGGGLALALLERAGELEMSMPKRTILISPWLDVRLNNPQIDEVQKRDSHLIKQTLIAAGIAYAGLDGIDSYLVNPIDGPLDKLENVTIYTGTDDILNPDVHVLVERAKLQGIEIDLRETKGAYHNWIIEKHTIKEKAYRDLITLLQKECI